MERPLLGSSRANVNDFDLLGFANSGNFEQFIDLFRGENMESINNYNPEDGNVVLNAQFVDNQLNPTHEDIFDFNFGSILEDQMFNCLPPINGHVEGDEEKNDGNESSDATTTKTKPNDRSRTLATERRRRGRMKEKLYALRALVPNISKMDKSSIVGDAVSYVQELQTQSRNLKSEIAMLESSFEGQGRCQGLQGSSAHVKKTQVIDNKQPANKNIVQVDVFEMEEKVYYMRLVCNKDEGVAPALYKALESLTFFHIQTSNLIMASEQFISTFTLNVTECGEEMSLSTMKLWVTAALMNQGFEFKHSAFFG